MKCITKPDIVSAVQFNGKNVYEIERFTGGEILFSLKGGIAKLKLPGNSSIVVSKGDYVVIKSGGGEIYASPPNVFESMYDLMS